ncbi:proline dehydrogenase [Naumannella cuiyingiana]|uniref:proline dehydrogenase n=1 Tax=Naumannella cuiyingiana TaxID=1347891 RepID=A0A7Z0ILD1_9ACTN|nr:proline dehydrogenase [Naumannella cuiyingiana]
MANQFLIMLSRAKGVRDIATRLPMTRSVVDRFVAGETTPQMVEVCRRLTDDGLLGTVDYLGEDTADLGQAAAVTWEYVGALAALAEAGIADRVEVSLKLSAIGQFLGRDGEKVALDNARQICQAAREAGTTVTLDMEDHTTTDSTLGILRELRADFPDTGAVIQAYLRRSEADCRDLTHAGSRVRLCKGAYAEPESVAYPDERDVELSYVRCLKVLMYGEGYPMVATHSPRLIAVAQDIAQRAGRGNDDFEFQMLRGVRPNAQTKLAGLGHRMRIYVPYGTDWYGYLVRRMAEKPANLGLFVRGLVDRN